MREMGVNSRMAPRVRVDLKVISRIPDVKKQHFTLAEGDMFEIRALDISMVGMGIISKHFLPKGLEIELILKGEPVGLNEDMLIKGEIRHCEYVSLHQYRCGVKFTGIADAHKDAISKFIEANERRRAPRIPL